MERQLPSEVSPDERPTVGVWVRTAPDTWQRDVAHRAEWTRWADVDTFTVRADARRIVWLGESLARGFLFDPVAPPAAGLQAALQSVLTDAVQVLDLGSNGMTACQLATTLDQLPALRPNALVFVAGNNWHHAADIVATDDARAALRTGGRLGLRRWCCETYLPAVAERLLQQLHRVAQQVGNIPVVVVIPAFNLADWRATPAQQHPCLQSTVAAAWYQAQTDAMHAQSRGHHADVEAAVGRMLEIDQGDAPLSHYWRASCAREHGDTDTVRAALEEARDASCVPGMPFLPRCPRTLQFALRQEAARHGFSVVDLPALFADHSADGLPGRALFLDYCHLTAEGNRLFLTQVARALLERIGSSALTPVVPTVSRSIQSQAHFLAAVHNARYAQPAEIVRHHCQMALQLDPHSAELMRWFAARAVSTAPLWLTSDASRWLNSPLLYRHLVAAAPWQPPLFSDLSIRAAIVDVLGEMPTLWPSISRELDLLTPRYCSRAVDEELPDDPNATTAYFRAHTPLTEFFLPLAEPQTLELEITCRTPVTSTVGLQVNGALLARWSVGPAWHSDRMPIPASYLSRGVNRLAIVWPTPGQATEVDPSKQKERWDDAWPDLRPRFGELFTLRVR